MSFTVGQIIKVSDLIALDNAIETEPVDITKINVIKNTIMFNNEIVDDKLSKILVILLSGLKL